MDLHDLLSGKTGITGVNAARFTDEYIGLWKQAPGSFPEFPVRYTDESQQNLGRKVDTFTEKLSKKLEHVPFTRRGKKKWLASISDIIYSEGPSFISTVPFRLDLFFRDDFIEATKQFLDLTFGFEKEFSLLKTYQAIRNVWIANTLQEVLHLPIKSSPSIFAYSMLYPYTDNVNDNAALTGRQKFEYNIRLKHWLEGAYASYTNEYEKNTEQLVNMIGAEFPRDRFPGVHESILSIYNAQINSMAQHSRKEDIPLERILPLTFMKGGTSVLADGFLVAGDMSYNQQRFCMGFGIFLQLLDDLQDFQEDCENGHRTLFTVQSAKERLDNLTNRLFNFIPAIFEYNRRFGFAVIPDVEQIMLNSCYLIIIDSVSRSKRYYSSGYCRELEAYYPVRYAVFHNLLTRAGKWYDILEKKGFEWPDIIRFLFSAQKERSLNPQLMRQRPLHEEAVV